MESILGPVGLMGPSDFSTTQDQGTGASEEGEASGEGDEEEAADEEQDGEQVDILFSLINTAPVSLDQPIEEPVTSGNDGPSGQ